MNRIANLTAVFFLMLAAFSARASDGEVLWWTIGLDYASIQADAGDGTFVTAGSLNVTDVRVRYDNMEDGSSGYLTFFGLGDDGETVYVYDGSAGLGGEYGAGLPAEYFGDLSGLSGSSASYSFAIELGNYIDGRWARTSMVSESVPYDELAAKMHIAKWEHETPVSGQAWSPVYYSVVPEPSGGLLMLVGGALLALRRKRGA